MVVKTMAATSFHDEDDDKDDADDDDDDDGDGGDDDDDDDDDNDGDVGFVLFFFCSYGHCMVTYAFICRKAPRPAPVRSLCDII